MILKETNYNVKYNILLHQADIQDLAALESQTSYSSPWMNATPTN